MSNLAFQSGGAAFALAGSSIARNALVTEIGVNYAIGPSATIGIAYSGQYSGGANENSGKASLTVRFREGRSDPTSAPIALNRGARMSGSRR